MWPSLSKCTQHFGKKSLLGETFSRTYFSSLTVVLLKINHPGGILSFLLGLQVKSLWGR